jgi:hypothetical protein
MRTKIILRSIGNIEKSLKQYVHRDKDFDLFTATWINPELEIIRSEVRRK